MTRKLTKNELLMRIGSELTNLRVVPANPMDIGEIARRGHLADRKTRALAMVVQAIVPSFNYGGMEDALEEWAAYLAEFHQDEETP